MNENTQAPSPAERNLAPGQKVFGRFILERRLGKGGMGVVWLARDSTLGDPVALKFVSDELKHDASAVEDLKSETRRARQLTHANIVRIHDYWEDETAAAVSMEFVNGHTLSDLRMKQPGRVYSAAELKPWIEQLCGALEYAHAKVKIVHRDLKPLNLMVDEHGDLKLTDFGISATITETTARVSKHASSGYTQTYASPQQLRGKRPTASDDIYSFGATLFELLTSRPPFFRGDIFNQTLSEVPPSIAERREEFGIDATPIPKAWEEVIAACLAKEPEQRPKSMKEIAARLLLEETPAAPLPPPLTTPREEAPSESEATVRRPAPPPAPKATMPFDAPVPEDAVEIPINSPNMGLPPIEETNPEHALPKEQAAPGMEDAAPSQPKEKGPGFLNFLLWSMVALLVVLLIAIEEWAFASLLALLCLWGIFKTIRSRNRGKAKKPSKPFSLLRVLGLSFLVLLALLLLAIKAWMLLSALVLGYALLKLLGSNKTSK